MSYRLTATEYRYKGTPLELYLKKTFMIDCETSTPYSLYCHCTCFTQESFTLKLYMLHITIDSHILQLLRYNTHDHIITNNTQGMNEWCNTPKEDKGQSIKIKQ